MALPNLPTAGQNPWYTDRTAWDTAVDGQISGFSTQLAALQTQVNGLAIGNPGKKYKIIACAIRNTGSGWGLIQDSAHEPVGVSGVSISSGMIQLQYNFTATRVGSLTVEADETFVGVYSAGPSVGLTFANIQVSKIGGSYDYITWNGTAWVSNTNFVTGVTMNATTGVIQFTHSSVSEAFGGSAELRSDGSNRAVAGGRGTTTLDYTVYPYNSTTSLKTPTTDMKFFISRPGARNIDATTLVSALGNFWILGFMEVA